MHTHDWIPLLTPLIGALLVLEIVRRVARRRAEDHRRWHVVGTVVSRCAMPVWVITTLVVFEITLPGRVHGNALSTTRHGLAIGLICGVTLLLVQVFYAATDIALARLQRALGTPDNRRARRARTQIVMIRRIAAAIAVIIALGLVLLTFTRVRALGASMLASAGIIGAVAGVAARPTIGNLIAGIQIAFSDMLRMDDIVVVMGEQGNVADITLSFVVIKTWDERRLIVPTSYFVDNPFENWTRTESEMIGWMYVALDYAVPVDEVRAELQRLLDKSALWDRRTWSVQVTDITAQGVQLRIAMSAPSSGASWDLRCEVREGLLKFLRERYPESFPRVRVEAATAPLELPPDWAEQAVTPSTSVSG